MLRCSGRVLDGQVTGYEAIAVNTCADEAELACTETAVKERIEGKRYMLTDGGGVDRFDAVVDTLVAGDNGAIHPFSGQRKVPGICTYVDEFLVKPFLDIDDMPSGAPGRRSRDSSADGGVVATTVCCYHCIDSHAVLGGHLNAEAVFCARVVRQQP